MSFALTAAAIGGVVSLIQSGVGLFNSATQSDLQRKLDELNKQNEELNAVQRLQVNFVNNFSSYSDALYQQNTMGLQIKNDRLSLKQTEANINAYDQALRRYDTQYAMGLRNLQSQGRSQLFSLMEQYGGVNVSNATRGQSGGSSSLIAQMAKNQVIEFAGDDMKLNANGGTYGYSLTDYFLDQMAELQETKGNRDIQADSWEGYHDALIKDMETYDSSIKLKGTALENMRKAFDSLYNYYGVDISSKYDEYQKNLSEYNSAMDAWLGGDTSYSVASRLSSSYNSLKTSYDAYTALIDKQKDAISPFNEELINQFITSENGKAYNLDVSNKLSDSWSALSSGYSALESTINAALRSDDDDDDDDDFDFGVNTTPTKTRQEQANELVEEKKYEKILPVTKPDSLKITVPGKNSSSTSSKPPYKNTSSSNKYSKGWRGR